MMSPRSVFEISRHSGELKAFRAALTAVSTSSAEAASTEVISDSSLRGMSVMALCGLGGSGTNLPGVDTGNLLARAGLDKLIVNEQASGQSNLCPVGSCQVD